MISSELIFIADLIAIFSIYLIINLSLNLEFGYAGIPNFGKVLSVAAGAFVVGIIPIRLYGMILGIDADPIHDNIELVSLINEHLVTHPELAVGVFAVTLVIAMLVGSALGAISSYPAIRLRGDYLAIVLLAFGEIIRIIGVNYEGIVGGTLGVGVPDFMSFLPEEYRFLGSSLMLLFFAGLVYFVVSRFTKSPVGRLLRSTRDDEVALQSLGRNTVNIKIKTLMIAGTIGAIADCFMHHM